MEDETIKVFHCGYNINNVPQIEIEFRGLTGMSKFKVADSKEKPIQKLRNIEDNSDKEKTTKPETWISFENRQSRVAHIRGHPATTQ